jgi:PPOX class probable F420-dependent enzyme
MVTRTGPLDGAHVGVGSSAGRNVECCRSDRRDPRADQALPTLMPPPPEENPVLTGGREPGGLGRWSGAPPDAGPGGGWSDGGVSDPANVPEPAVLKRLAEEQNVWLCPLRPDGSAHVSPVWFVYRSSRWWIGAEAGAVKVRNVQADPRVSLALEDGRAPVVAEGEASLIRDGFPDEVVTAFNEKYAWNVTAPTRPGPPADRVLLEVHVHRWLLSGRAR